MASHLIVIGKQLLDVNPFVKIFGLGDALPFAFS